MAETIASSTRTMAMDLSELVAGEQLARVTADLEIGLLLFNAGADPPHVCLFGQASRNLVGNAPS